MRYVVIVFKNNTINNSYAHSRSLHAARSHEFQFIYILDGGLATEIGRRGIISGTCLLSSHTLNLFILFIKLSSLIQKQIQQRKELNEVI